MFFWFIYFFTFETSATASCGYTGIYIIYIYIYIHDLPKVFRGDIPGGCWWLFIEKPIIYKVLQGFGWRRRISEESTVWTPHSRSIYNIYKE